MRWRNDFRLAAICVGAAAVALAFGAAAERGAEAVLVLAVLAGVLAACGVGGWIVGRSKEKAVEGALLGAMLGPLGVLAAAALDGRPQCPECRGRLPGAGGRVCPHCRADLSTTGEPPPIPSVRKTTRTRPPRLPQPPANAAAQCNAGDLLDRL